MDFYHRDIKSDPGCGSAKLVYLATWEYRGLTYWAFIRSNKNHLYFEGKYRKRNGRHTYFPLDNYNCIDLGDEKDAVREVEKILNKYHCPKEEYDAVMEKINGWILT